MENKIKYVKIKYNQLIKEIENLRDNQIESEIDGYFFKTHILLDEWVQKIWNMNLIINKDKPRVRCDSCDDEYPSSPTFNNLENELFKTEMENIVQYINRF